MKNASDSQRLHPRALGLGFPAAVATKREKQEPRMAALAPSRLTPSGSAGEDHLFMLPGKISLEKKILLRIDFL